MPVAAGEIAGFEATLPEPNPHSALVVGEPVAFGTDGEASGRTQAAGDGGFAAVGRFIRSRVGTGTAWHAEGNAEGDAEIAVGASNRPEGVFVVAVGDGLAHRPVIVGAPSPSVSTKDA
jgi:hypothetical protein